MTNWAIKGIVDKKLAIFTCIVYIVYNSLTSITKLLCHMWLIRLN